MGGSAIPMVENILPTQDAQCIVRVIFETLMFYYVSYFVFAYFSSVTVT